MRHYAVLAAIALAAVPGAAGAQAWIGQVVGQMAAQQAEAQREAACRAGKPAEGKVVPWASTSSDEAVAAYLALNPKSKPGDLKKAFAMKQPDVRWKGPQGEVPVAELPARLDGAAPTLTRTSFVLAGDGASARGIWEAKWAGEPGRKAWYAIDFAGGYPDIWGGGHFRIWHMTVFAGDQQPEAPAAYCHFDPDQAW